jgi:hypothetical protein
MLVRSRTPQLRPYPDAEDRRYVHDGDGPRRARRRGRSSGDADRGQRKGELMSFNVKAGFA